MPISIKNEETEALARELAERLRWTESKQARLEELREIAMRCARRPVISQMSDDEILGYDEFGVPSR